MTKIVLSLCIIASMSIASEFKVYGISLGDKRGTLPSNTFVGKLPIDTLNCKSKCCKAFTYDKRHHFNKFRNNGAVNLIEVCYNSNNEVNEIYLHSEANQDYRIIDPYMSFYNDIKNKNKNKKVVIKTGYTKTSGKPRASILFHN